MGKGKKFWDRDVTEESPSFQNSASGITREAEAESVGLSDARLDRPPGGEPVQSTVDVVGSTAVVVVADPNQAAELLMQYLPSVMRELILEAQRTLSKPLWQMLLGYVVRSYDRMELFHPYLLSQWEYQRPWVDERKCERCGELFSPPVPDGAYCCNNCFFGKLDDRGHSDVCSTRMMNADAASGR